MEARCHNATKGYHAGYDHEQDAGNRHKLASTVSVLSYQKGCDAGDHAAGAGAVRADAAAADAVVSLAGFAGSQHDDWCAEPSAQLGIRCRLRSLAMLGLLAGVLSLVLLVRLLLLALPVLRCCRMAG